MHVMLMILNAWDHTQGLGNLPGGRGGGRFASGILCKSSVFCVRYGTFAQ